MNRNEFVAAIRSQTDLDAADVSDLTAHTYLQEAFERTTAQRRHWPSYESVWSYSVEANDASVTLATDVAEIASVMSSAANQRLSYIDHDFAEEAYSRPFGRTSAFSIWGGKMFLWPGSNSATTLTVRGWRRPSYSWLSDTALEADLDERLHSPLLHYAVALVYAQQEDLELESQYMRRWSAGVEDAARDIVRPPSYRPIVLNGGERQGMGRSSFDTRLGFDSL
jgi:hypothetical protein